jgi:predicted nucleic acid-binding protein
LAALTIANGWRLVSVDRNFERFDGLVAAEGQDFGATDVLWALTG